MIFNQDVTGCSYQVSTGGPTTGLSFGDAAVGQLPAVAGGVRVFILNTTGTAFTDQPFNVAVFC